MRTQTKLIVSEKIPAPWFPPTGAVFLRYQNLAELARVMGISKDLIYRVERGERNISERFIVRATKAFPGYKLDDLIYVSED